MKQEIDNNAMWAAFRQELALQGEVHVVAAIDNALNNLGFTIEETSTIIPISLKQGEKKPVEWSNNDEKMFLDIESLIHSYRTGSYEHELSSWLKSLKNRIQPQPKQEWSKEDEALREKVINTIWAYANTPHCCINCKSAEEIVDWLKSLRPQKQWKPDSSQLVSLQYAINHLKKEGDRNILTRLLEQLKAL